MYIDEGTINLFKNKNKKRFGKTYIEIIFDFDF
jgi:hypothetical protein